MAGITESFLRYLRVITTSGVYLRPSEVQPGLDLSNTVFVQAWENGNLFSLIGRGDRHVGDVINGDT